MTLVFRDLDGNIVTDAGTEPENSTATRTPAYTSDSTVPVNFDKYQGQEEPEPQTPEGSSYVDTDTTSTNRLGAGQGFLAGLEEINEFNPFGGVALPVAAGLVAPFSDKTYSEIKDEMSRRQKERKDIGRATEGEGFRGVRETTQKVGEKLEPIAGYLMGNALLGAAAKTNTGAKVLQAASKLPGAPTAAKVVGSTVASRNPIVRAGSFAGLVGGGTLIKDLAQGENLSTAASDAVKNASLVAAPTLAAGYLPARAFYPAAAAAGVGSGYLSRKSSGEGTKLSDAIADALGGVAQGRLYRTIIPKYNAYEKGSKFAKGTDRYKDLNKVTTENLRDEIAQSGYSGNTPVLQVPLEKNKDFVEHYRRVSPAKASDFVRKNVRPARIKVSEQLKSKLDKDYPMIKDTPVAQEAQSEALARPAGLFDKQARARADARPIKAERLDRVAPIDSTSRTIIDKAYNRAGGVKGPDNEYNRVFLDKARVELGKGDPSDVKAANDIKKVLAYHKTRLKEWNKADSPSHESIVTVQNIKDPTTAESSVAKVKNTVWRNTHDAGGGVVESVTPDKLEKMGVGNKGLLPEGIEKQIRQHDYLVELEKLGNAPVASSGSSLFARGAAAWSAGGALAKYNVLTKFNEWLGSQAGKFQTRGVASALQDMTLDDLKNLLNVKWGSSVPLGEILSTIKNMPKVKKEERK